MIDILIYYFYARRLSCTQNHYIGTVLDLDVLRHCWQSAIWICWGRLRTRRMRQRGILWAPGQKQRILRDFLRLTCTRRLEMSVDTE
jgi:hypothetical protein